VSVDFLPKKAFYTYYKGTDKREMFWGIYKLREFP